MKPVHLLLGMAFLLLGCASVQNITGGAQDTTPPRLIAATPKDRSTMFDTKAILLEFDERIQLDRVRDRMLISPPLKTAPDVKLAGPRGVEILLNAPLEPGTTYTFNLGDCVKDLTEGNTAPGLSYVVSTGPHLDSARFSGTVTNAFSAAPEKEIMVGLYAPNDSAAFRKGRPLYMTRTDADGHFTMSNLAPGRFSVFVLRDKNTNHRYDLPNEEIAFLDSAIGISAEDTVEQAHLLRAFLPTSARQQVRSYSVTVDGALELVLARPVVELSVRDVARSGGGPQWGVEYNATRDSILLWPSDTTLIGQGAYEVSGPDGILDTLRYRPTRKVPYHSSLVATMVEDGGRSFIRVKSSRPITTIDSTWISLERDSTTIPFRIEADGTRAFNLAFSATSGATYRLLILPKAVRDVQRATNDTLRAVLGTGDERSFGSLRVNVMGLEGSDRYLLQVLDGQQRTQHETMVTAADPEAVWSRLTPGLRTLRLIHDRNGNGHWDTGEWASMAQPERTWYHPEQVNIRAAWDVELDWTVDGPVTTPEERP